MLTVAICTWNRAATLDRTLGYFQRLILPPGLDWELIVVDNNCTDDTQQVLKKHSRRLPLRAVFEKEPGLSNARNLAIESARGDLLVWTDDDVCVSPEWLVTYRNALDEYPNAAFFGGPITPRFDEEPPRWLRSTMPYVEQIYGKIDMGPKDRPLTPEALPFGANFAVRNNLPRQFHFNSSLGRREAEMLAGEETAFMHDLLNAGYQGVWLANARIEHCIPPQLMTLEYLSNRLIGSGKTVRDMKLGKQRNKWHMRAKIAFYESICRAFQWLGRPEIWVRYRLRASFLRGQLQSS